MPNTPQHRPQELEDIFRSSTQTIDNLTLPTLDTIFSQQQVEDDEEDTLKQSVRGGILRAEKLLAHDPLEETFEQFFQKNAPARTLLLDNLRSGFSALFGVKHVKLRDELREDYKQQRALAVQVQRNAATATLGFERLEVQREANEERARAAQSREEQADLNARNAVIFKVQALQNEAVRLELAVAKGTSNEKTADLTRKNLQKKLDNLISGSPFETIIKKELDDGASFSEALGSFTKFQEALAKAKDTPSAVERLMTNSTVQETVSAIEGGISKLDSLPNELEIPVRSAMYARRSVIQNPQFRKEAATQITGIDLFTELTSLVRQAKTDAGISEDSSNIRQRLAGLFNRSASVIGFESLTKIFVVGRLSLAEATKLARAAGEQRVTDVDLIRFLGTIPNVADPESVIKELFGAGIRNMLITMRNSISTLPQINPPTVSRRRSLDKLQDDAQQRGLSVIQMLIEAKRLGVAYE